MGRAGNPERGSRFFLFVKNDYLLKFMDEYKQKCATDNASREHRNTCPGSDIMVSAKKPLRGVHWEDWGPQNTRFMSYGIQFKWLRSVWFPSRPLFFARSGKAHSSTRYVHGQKVVCPPYTVGQGTKRISVLEVLDFNVHVERLPPEISARDILDHENPEKVPDSCVLCVETGPSTVVKPDIFTDPVVSQLPYTRAIRMHMEEMYSGFMIDEERVVGLRVRNTICTSLESHHYRTETSLFLTIV
jgi:hypothetical protein